jgi:hypothetical protein
MRRLRLWFARLLARPYGVGLYDDGRVLDARAALWRLSIYIRRSGHLTNGYKAGKRVRRGVEHAVELLARGAV